MFSKTNHFKHFLNFPKFVHYNDRTGPQCKVPNLNAPSSRINTLRYNFFTSMGPRLFNSLPKAVKECSSPDIFKKTLELQFIPKF